ncbi:MAG: heme exporter protein CcmB [Spirochaetota bacterium]|nr:heme exporter protein CcmB [Spirochaetota bacterium]
MIESILASSVVSNLQKDFRIEFRNRYALNVSISFAIISTLAISLSSGGIPISNKMQSVLFWIILFFSAMNGLSHIFIREEEQGTSLFLRLNAKPEVVLTSKLLFNISLFFLLQVVVTPLFIFFLQMNILSPITFVFTIGAGGFAISSSTTILAAIVAKAGGRGSLFTIISFPIVLPILWISINSTTRSLEVAKYTGYENLVFLLAFSAAIIALSFIIFEYIWMDE